MFLGKKGVVGLDIGSSYIKAVKLKEVKGGYELEMFDMLPIPPEVIVGGSVIDSVYLTKSLKELIRKARIKTKDAVIGIAGHASVIIKKISLPEMSEEELSESIKFEAEQYIPFDIEEVELDFHILESKEKSAQMDVIVVAAKKDVLNGYIAAVREAGLNPVVVDVNAFALGNIYELNYGIEPRKNIALLNIGASTINMNILKGGVSVFARDSAIGSNIHTEALQREFNLTYEDAERLKMGESVENVSLEDALSVIESVSGEIIKEVNRSFDYFRNTMPLEDIDEVILSGGCALIKGFPRLFEEGVGIKTTVMKPYENIRIPKRFDVAYIKEVAPMAAVATGLALRRADDRW